MKTEDLQVGDVITIPKDQYRHPCLAVDPVTRKVAEPRRLREFVVVAIDPKPGRQAGAPVTRHRSKVEAEIDT